MPFGKYKDFAACVRANQDKKSPEGYCASIEKKITGQWPGQMRTHAAHAAVSHSFKKGKG